MSIKTFEFIKNDIKMLKRDWILRFILSILLLAVAGWQVYLFTTEIITNDLDQFEIISSVFVFASSFIYVLLGIIYVIKQRAIIRAINQNGKCTSSVPFIFNVNKLSFAKLYKFITILLTILSIFVLIASITYAILSIAIYKELSFFYPVLINLCLIGLYSSLHISTGIKALEKVSRINAM